MNSMSEEPAPRPALAAPSRRVLEGRYCRLEPIGPQHAHDIFAACAGEGAEERFRYLFSYPPRDLADMEAWIETAAAKPDPLMFAVVDMATGRAGGYQALMRIVPEHGVIEIGSILWGRGIAKTRIATEALFLFARHVFEDLGYRRFEWKCNALNLPSRRAAQRFGFSFEGVFRQHMIVKGKNRDTAWFAMLDGEWQEIRAAHEAWLDPSNFDAEGRQKVPLRIR